MTTVGVHGLPPFLTPISVVRHPPVVSDIPINLAPKPQTLGAWERFRIWGRRFLSWGKGGITIFGGGGMEVKTISVVWEGRGSI